MSHSFLQVRIHLRNDILFHFGEFAKQLNEVFKHSTKFILNTNMKNVGYRTFYIDALFHANFHKIHFSSFILIHYLRKILFLYLRNVSVLFLHFQSGFKQ